MVEREQRDEAKERERESDHAVTVNKPGRRDILPVSLYFFNSRQTAHTFTFTPSFLSISTIVVDLNPFAIQWYGELITALGMYKLVF